MARPHKMIIFAMLLGWNSMLLVAGANHFQSPELQDSRHKRSTNQSKNELEITDQQQQTTGDFKPDAYSKSRLANMNMHSLSPLNIVKRAPMGFLGMRGKKGIDDEPVAEMATNDIDSNQLPSSNGISNPIDSSFDSNDLPLSDASLYHSMNELYDVDEKRVPNGFLGMRGKKDTIMDELMYLENLKDHQSNMQQRLQNERRLIADFARQYEGFELTPIDSGGGAIKRAPSTGFFGMRGKKTFNDDLDEAAKRTGPGLGFVGMRGKKWADEEDSGEQDNSIQQEYGGIKRAPSMGFHGMRGKKDVRDVMKYEKRAPSTGFFGMRGKKGFFGIRGKKGPYELRHKFVGVRGKKIPGGVPVQQFQLRMGNEYLMPEMQSAHLADTDLQTAKRIPIGFLGMRGKKSWDSTLD